MQSTVVLRFPTGTEYRIGGSIPKVGDTIRRDGVTWVVSEVSQGEKGEAVVTFCRLAESVPGAVAQLLRHS